MYHKKHSGSPHFHNNDFLCKNISTPKFLVKREYFAHRRFSTAQEPMKMLYFGGWTAQKQAMAKRDKRELVFKMAAVYQDS